MILGLQRQRENYHSGLCYAFRAANRIAGDPLGCGNPESRFVILRMAKPFGRAQAEARRENLKALGNAEGSCWREEKRQVRWVLSYWQ